MNDGQPTSTRPYLLRALYEWCADNGYTPHIAVAVDDSVAVPREYVKDGEIVLNISHDAAHGLRIDNDAVSFKARFAGVAREVYVPVGRVIALFARENGQGMGFPAEETPVLERGEDPAPLQVQVVSSTDRVASESAEASSPSVAPAADEPPKPGGGRPALRRIK